MKFAIWSLKVKFEVNSKRLKFSDYVANWSQLLSPLGPVNRYLSLIFLYFLFCNHTLMNNKSNCGNLSILEKKSFNVNCRESKAHNSLSGGERNQSRGTIILNVGGSIHQVKWETIDKFPKSRLQRLCYATSESKSNQQR